MMDPTGRTTAMPLLTDLRPLGHLLTADGDYAVVEITRINAVPITHLEFWQGENLWTFRDGHWGDVEATGDGARLDVAFLGNPVAMRLWTLPPGGRESTPYSALAAYREANTGALAQRLLAHPATIANLREAVAQRGGSTAFLDLEPPKLLGATLEDDLTKPLGAWQPA